MKPRKCQVEGCAAESVTGFWWADSPTGAVFVRVCDSHTAARIARADALTSNDGSGA